MERIKDIIVIALCWVGSAIIIFLVASFFYFKMVHFHMSLLDLIFGAKPVVVINK